MLNHKDKYIHFQLYQQSEFQKMYIAQKKSPGTEQVLVNVLPKTSLVQPVDVSSVINAIHCLEMLEEDSENWYFVTTHFNEKGFLETTDNNGQLSNVFETKHFVELMSLISTYDYLTPYYQMMLLNENQFLLHNHQVVSREVLDLAFLPDILPDFTTVKTQFNVLIAQTLQLLKANKPELYSSIDWFSQFSKANSLNSLKELAQYWSEEILTFSNRLQPEVLANLYAVNKESVAVQGAAPTNKNYASLQNGNQAPKQKKNLAIVATCILAITLIAASLAPSLIDFFSHLGDQQTTTEPNTSKGTTPSNSGEDANGTSDEDTGETTASPTLEQLNPDNISFLSGKWSYDQTQFHTGDRSLKLILDKSSPSGIVEFTNLDIPNNPSFSLWMRSDQGGNISAIFTFTQGGQTLGRYEETLNFESGGQWYLVNPIATERSKDFSNADTLQIELSGDVNIFWLDDLQFESFK